MRYSPSAVKKVVRQYLASSARVEGVTYSKAWVTTKRDEEEGGFLNGNLNQTFEGDICINLNGLQSTVIGSVR